MKQKDKNSNQTRLKNIVKDIFTRSKAGGEKISPIFTHFRHSAKIILPTSQEKVPSLPLKLLPVAIDIGTSSIKLLQMAEGEKGRPEIVCIDEEGFSPGVDYDSTASIMPVLKNIVNRNRTSSLCVTTLSPKHAQLYNMLFPPMPEAELIAAIRYKVTQLKSFDSDIEKLIIRFSKWDSVGKLSKSSPQRIIVACVVRDILEQKMSLFQEVGLELVKIGIWPFDLVNLSKFYKGRELKDETTLWIDLGAENTFLAVEKGGSLCFSRNLTVTSKYITKALAKYRGVSEEEAESLKRNYGLIFWSADKKIPLFYESGKSPAETEDKSEMVYYGLISHLENLVVDIMHSFKYFSYQIAQSKITRFDRVILSGGGANLKNLDRFLGARLGVSVERINPFSLFRLSDIMQRNRKNLIGTSSNFAVCTGLAIGQKIGEPRQINLLPEEKERPVQIFAEALKQWPVMAAVSVMILAISLAIFLVGEQYRKAGYYKKEMNSLTKEIRAAKVQLGNMQARQLNLNKEEAELLNKNALLEAKLNLVQKGLRIPEDFSGKFTSIADLLPEDIWVTKLYYKDGKLIITGSTSDMALIAALIEDIKSSKEFLDADFNYTEKDPATQIYNFEVITDVGV